MNEEITYKNQKKRRKNLNREEINPKEKISLFLFKYNNFHSFEKEYYLLK